jgi:hypothetical protein
MDEHFVVCLLHVTTPYVARCTEGEFLLSPQDFLDLLAWGGERGTNLFLLSDTNFAAAFYDLTTGLAGEVFQKASNYHARLAIVGSFAMVTSKRFRELMGESNKSRHVYFAPTEDEALAWLMS